MADPIRQLTELMKKQGLPTTGESAIEWYRKSVDRLRDTFPIKGTVQKVFKGRGQVGNLRKGDLYMFRYIPEGRKELEYYDEYPLVIATEINNNYIRGLNLHYLPHKYRAIFFSNLMILTTNKQMNEMTRIRIKNSMVRDMSKYRYGRVCQRTYALNRIRSKVIKIKPTEWFASLFLPTEKFIRKSKASIWSDSRRKLGEELK